MRAIKDKFNDETKVIINADSQITYEAVVAAMDAIRNEGSRQLFPDVLLSAGVQ
jgi:biopolymer transport protein ExbD